MNLMQSNPSQDNLLSVEVAFASSPEFYNDASNNAIPVLPINDDINV